MAARTEAGIEPRWTGMCSAWASSSPAGCEQRRRAVGPLLDVRVKRPPGAAPLPSRQPRRSAVRDRMRSPAGSSPGHPSPHRRSCSDCGRGPRPVKIQAPRGPGSAVHPSGIHTVQSGFDGHHRAGAALPDRRGQVGRFDGRRPAGPGPERHDLHRRVGAGIAVAPLVLCVEGLDDRHGQLVALPPVAAVEGELHLNDRSDEPAFLSSTCRNSGTPEREAPPVATAAFASVPRAASPSSSPS